MNHLSHNECDDILLLKKFNDREDEAFCIIYNYYYMDFHLYATKLYAGTSVEPKDMVHDVFLYILQNKDIVFNELINIKAFVIIALKNRYKKYINHIKYEKLYKDYVECEDNFEVDIIENSIYSNMEQILQLLPNECAKVIKLYLEGWKPEEIARFLGKQTQTVYNKKQEAISILRKKLSRDKLLSLALLIYMIK